MLCNITLCKACLNRLVGRNKFVRFKSHYAVLGVTQKATQKEIRDAYIKLSKQMHPDQNRQDNKSHDKFVQINEAYEVLSKDGSRRDYDEKLRLHYPKPTANPYKASRPSNYYSSGQFYETPYYRTGFDPSNPYARRSSTNFESDPFSDTNYDHSFYQRKSVRKPRPTGKPMTTEERRAAEEKMRADRMFVYYVVNAIFFVLILTRIFSRDDYLVKKQEEAAGVSWKPAEAPMKNDPVVKAFDRIFWLMAFAMLCYLIKEAVYTAYLNNVLSDLKEDLERRKKIEEHRTAEKIVRSIYPTPGKS